jgi:carbon-monoxide dehydrogenase small subunit
MKLSLSTTINGQKQEVQVGSNQTLLEFLRDDLKLKGTVEGCSVGVCGSCTALIDGKPVSSCLTLASNIEGREARPSKASHKMASSIPYSEPF